MRTWSYLIDCHGAKIVMAILDAVSTIYGYE